MKNGGKQHISVAVWMVAGFPRTQGFKVPLASAEQKPWKWKMKAGLVHFWWAKLQPIQRPAIKSVWAEPGGQTNCTSSTETKELLSIIFSLILMGKFACYFFFIFPIKEITDRPETTKPSVLWCTPTETSWNHHPSRLCKQKFLCKLAFP